MTFGFLCMLFKVLSSLWWFVNFSDANVVTWTKFEYVFCHWKFTGHHPSLLWAHQFRGPQGAYVLDSSSGHVVLAGTCRSSVHHTASPRLKFTAQSTSTWWLPWSTPQWVRVRFSSYLPYIVDNRYLTLLGWHSSRPSVRHKPKKQQTPLPLWPWWSNALWSPPAYLCHQSQPSFNSKIPAGHLKIFEHRGIFYLRCIQFTYKVQIQSPDSEQ